MTETRRRRLLGWLGLLVCLAIVAGLNAALREEGVQFQTVRGSRGDTVRGAWYDITVLDVRVSDTVVRRNARMTSDEVLVAVTWKGKAKRERARFDQVNLRTRAGDRYRQRSEFREEAVQAAPPGFTSSGLSVFEIPKDALAGAELLVGPDTDTGFMVVYDEQVVVDLGLTADAPRVPAIEVAKGRVEVEP